MTTARRSSSRGVRPIILRQAENYSTLPNDNRFWSADYGPSGDIPAFSATVNGSEDFTGSMQLSWVYRIRGGLRIDPRVGPTVDVNGDGSFNDRTPTLARNSFEGPWVNSLDIRYSYFLPLSTSGKLQLQVEAFNLFNTENWRTLNTLYGSVPGTPNPVFGTALSYYPPRQVQLGARYSF